ncbi:MAG: hypothetical protein ING69_10555 [Rhodocyclaceae bacterium]|nr:hypothetical protein [Rhodocyclaceae bacterium]
MVVINDKAAGVTVSAAIWSAGPEIWLYSVIRLDRNGPENVAAGYATDETAVTSAAQRAVTRCCKSIWWQWKQAKAAANN